MPYWHSFNRISNKISTVQETDTSSEFHKSLFLLWNKVFVDSDINNYGKFYTYGTKVNLGIAQGSKTLVQD